MPTLTLSQGLSGAGLNITSTQARSGDGLIGHGGSGSPITLPVGLAGNLSLRTDSDTGNLTIPGHSFMAGDKIDVYFAEGSRFGMTVGNVSGNTVPIDLGGGDILPSQGNSVVASARTQINTMIDGDNLGALSLVALQPTDPTSTDQFRVEFQDSGNSSIGNITLQANRPYILDIEGGATNILTGNVITKVLCSNGSTDTEGTIEILGVQDTTP